MLRYKWKMVGVSVNEQIVVFDLRILDMLRIFLSFHHSAKGTKCYQAILWLCYSFIKTKVDGIIYWWTIQILQGHKRFFLLYLLMHSISISLKMIKNEKAFALWMFHFRIFHEVQLRITRYLFSKSWCFYVLLKKCSNLTSKNRFL